MDLQNIEIQNPMVSAHDSENISLAFLIFWGLKLGTIF